MGDLAQKIATLSPKRLALVALDLEARLERLEQVRTEPIAVVGMGCRFPGGVDSPDALWALLDEGRDVVSETPKDRWDNDELYDPDPDAPGKVATKWGGFLADIAGFDPAFFSISPREAASMDPQQRLLLEVAWEALEHAGISPDAVAGTRTGVFVGVCNTDYFQLLSSRDPADFDLYMASGSASSVVSGRLSYILGLRGPALSIDTACSSSLVAIHQACQSLRAGESRTAIAGGVNVICSPATTVALSRSHMMAPDGRCKAFDASADGFVRGEGCGLVVLKRLSDAQADGDRVLAVIRASAANQDGRSNGLTAPNGPSQESVIRDALAQAGIAPAAVDYVEAHGTGTSLGDPIEVRALGAVLGEGRPAEAPVVIGSIKTNVGHLESAAGVAGLMKVVLSLQHGRIPASLHFKTPNPHIEWDRLPVTVAAEPREWRPTPGRPRVAGLSSFGFSGTNVHLLVEDAPPEPTVVAATEPRGPYVLPLSARTEAALASLVARYEAHLAAHPGEPLADVCSTAAAGRAHHEHRVAIVAADRESLLRELQARRSGTPGPASASGRLPLRGTPEIAFLFTGHGSQYPGMARGLYESEPVFRAAVERCAAIADAGLEAPLAEILYGARTDLLEQAMPAETATFAVEYALAALWESWGVKPSLAVGHGSGEYAAACVAGVFDVESALRLIAARGRLMQRMTRPGALAAVFASEGQVSAVLGGAGVEIAAINAPDAVVIAGGAEEVAAALAALEAAGIRGQRLGGSHAFNSSLVEPALGEFQSVAATIAYRAPQMELVSGETGRLTAPAEIDAAYWCRHLRRPIRYAEAVAELRRRGCQLFVEIGPAPTLIGPGRRTVEDATWVPSLRQGRDDRAQMLTALARIYTQGAPVQWSTVMPRGRRVELPRYPFQRERFWMSSGTKKAPAAERPPAAAPPVAAEAGFPGRRVDAAMPIFATRFSLDTVPFLEDHRLHDAPLVPAPVYLELARGAAREAFGSDGWAVRDLQIQQPLVTGGRAQDVQTVLATSPGGAAFQVFARPVDAPAASWTQYATGSLVRAAATLPEPLDLAAVRERCAELRTGDEHDRALRAEGVHCAAVKLMPAIWRTSGEALGQLDVPAPLVGAGPYGFHPTVLDAATLLAAAAIPASYAPGPGEMFVLGGIDEYSVHGLPAARMFAHLVLQPSANGELQGELRLVDAQGKAVASLRGVHLKRMRQDWLRRLVADEVTGDWFYEVGWPEQALAGPPAARLPLPFEADANARIAVPAELRARHGLARYDALFPELDRLSAAYVVEALRKLGLDWRIGTTRSFAGLMEELRIVPRYERLVRRLFAMLEQDGAVRVAGDAIEVTGAAGTGANALLQSVRERYPDFAAEVCLLGTCGSSLAEVLSGACDPVHLLFGNPDASAERLYYDAPFALAGNDLVRRSLDSMLEGIAPGASLRVLEVGAGTGGTTIHVLPALAGRCARYAFTDISAAFLARARARFAGHGFVEYRPLDIERDPRAQGFEPHQFDLVIASNVLHATADLGSALDHVGTLLAPDGVVLLLEGTAPQRWIDLTFGLTDGWWRFSDTGLRGYPLIGRDQWLSLLASRGFAQQAALPEAPEELTGLAVIAARRPAMDVAPAAGSPEWLVFADRGGTADALVARLRRRGASCATVTAAGGFACTGEGTWMVGPGTREDTAKLLSALREAGGLPKHVVYLPALDATGPGDGPEGLESRAVDVSARLLGVAQALADASPAPRLWIATAGALPVAGTTPVNLDQSPVSALARVVTLEHPDVWTGTIDLDPACGPRDNAAVIERELLAGDGEDQVGHRAGRRHVARLQRRSSPSGSLALRGDGTYLVSGGLGGVGLEVAADLAARGAGHVALVGRSRFPDRALWDALDGNSRDGRRVAVIRAIEAAGARVHVVSADISSAAGVAALLAQLHEQGAAPVRGVFHAAAHLEPARIADLDRAALARMFAPKVTGTRALHEAFAGPGLDCFVLFSSTTAILGAAALGHYAAANQYLDAFAHYRRGLGLPALSVNFGTWEVMRVATADERRRLAQGGLEPMPSSQALGALARLIAAGDGQATVAAIDWDALKALYEARGARPLLERVGSARPAAPPVPAEEVPDSVLARLEQVPESERRSVIVGHIRAEASRILGLGPDRPIELDRGLFEMGMDSLMSVELKNALERSFGRRLPSTLTFNYPSVNALAQFICADVLQRDQAPAPPAPAAAPVGPDAGLDDLDDKSEDELVALLAARLGEGR